jgi:hypothetical protein
MYYWGILVNPSQKLNISIIMKLIPQIQKLIEIHSKYWKYLVPLKFEEKIEKKVEIKQENVESIEKKLDDLKIE